MEAEAKQVCQEGKMPRSAIVARTRLLAWLLESSGHNPGDGDVPLTLLLLAGRATATNTTSSQYHRDTLERRQIYVMYLKEALNIRIT